MRVRSALVVLAALTAVTSAAFAAPFSELVQPAMRALPTTVRATPTASPSASPAAKTGWTNGARPLPPLPPMPKGTSKIRRIRSANGACIEFSFESNACVDNGNASENFTAGSNITWQAIKLPATTAVYKDYVLTPTNGGAPTAISTTAYAGPTGTSHTQTGVTNGIYVFAVLNTSTNNWDDIAYVLVGSPVAIETYTDGSLSSKSQNFTTSASGAATVYIAATGLNATDSYAIGIEDQITGKCVYTAPASAQTTTPSTLCQLGSTAVTGTNPNGNGTLVANWGLTLQTYPTVPFQDTYMVTVYDQTANQRVATRLFAVIDGRTTGSTGRINLQFVNNVGTTSGASHQRIAWNGTATSVDDPSQTYMNLEFGASGLPSGDTDNLVLAITDPTGNVMKETTTTENYGTTIITPSYNQWALPTETLPFEQAFPGSTWEATIYDSVSKQMVAAQSFQVLGYSGSVLFQNPTAASTVIPTSPGYVTTSLAFTNTSDQTFGTNNGDPLVEFYATTAASANKLTKITLLAPGSSTTCTPASGAPCSGTYADTSGNAWTASVACGTCGTNADYTITVTPVSASTVMKPGSSVTVSGLTFYGTSCTTNYGCVFESAVVPQDAIVAGTLSGGTDVSNPFVLTNQAGGDTATGSAWLAGYYDSGGAWHANQDAGYTPRFNQATMALNNPFTSAASKLVFAYKVNDTSTETIQIFDLLLPSGMPESTVAVDSHSPNAATITTNGYCDGIPRATICVTPSTTIAAGTSQTFYFSITPPSTSFSYTDLVGTLIQTSYDGYAVFPVTITPSGTNTTFIGSPTSVDSTALAAYSLNGALMVGQVTPGSVGTNTTNTLDFNFRNTAAGADPFPDEIDFVALQIPYQTYATFPTACGALTVSTTGWSCLSVSSGTGQPTTYYFGQCSQQVSPLPTLPASSTSFGSDNLTVCPFSTQNEPYSLTSGSILNVSIPVTTGSASTGTPITISSWGHGATTDAWTTPVNSTLSVQPSAAAGVGFSEISNVSGTLVPITPGTQPSIAGNYNATTGNTYVYTIKNTGNVAITSAVIAIPGEDTTGSNGADSSGVIWKITAAPTLTMSSTGTADGCTETYANPTSGTATNGNITITCPSGVFTQGNTLSVQFTALAPDKINSTYNFPATINGSTTAATSNWYADTQILIALSANVAVAVNGSASCAGVTLTPATLTVNFGTVPASTNRNCADAMIVTVTTDASDPTNWTLYASVDANPSRTGAGSANELNLETDSTNSTGATTVPCPTSITPPCMAYDNTAAYTPVLLTSTGSGTRLAYTTQGGTGDDTNPIKIYVNYQVSIGTETVPPTGHQQTITYTWIAN
ncbi:MAG TPA: hypothetical protein VMD91_07915 [Candidatus Sulfotelmatobacter sp.]|nr:hypothetical protein [Candidatus Sulfotelmatobacter sp.]